MVRPRVSVLLPTNSRPDVLGAAIASVLDQTFSDFELLIVLDGVADETRHVLEQFKDGRLRVFDLAKSPNFGYANRNIALREARGDLIAYASDDDLWLHDHLETMEALFHEDRVEWAHSRPLWVSPSGKMFPVPVNLRRESEMDAFMTTGNVLPASTVVHRSACFSTSGYWPEDVAAGGDWELWKTILRTGNYRNFAATRNPTQMHFRTTRRAGRDWGPLPLGRMEALVDSQPGWSAVASLEVSHVGPEQLAVAAKMAADPGAFARQVRDACSELLERFALLAASGVSPSEAQVHDRTVSVQDLQPLVREAFRSDLEIPLNHATLASICQILTASASHEAAMRVAHGAVAAFGDVPWALMALARACQGGAHVEEAERAYAKAATVAPDNPAIFLPYGQFLQNLKKFKESLPVLLKACELGPAQPWPHYYLGLAYLHTGNLLDAEANLLRATELLPSNPNMQASLKHVRAKRSADN